MSALLSARHGSHSVVRLLKILRWLGASMLLALLTAPAVSASLWLRFTPESGVPGTAVEAQTVGSGAFGKEAPRSVDVFLVSTNTVEDVSGADDEKLLDIGSLRIDGDGNGKLTFRVPSLAPGRYTAIANCPSCAQYSDGRTLLPVGNFDVAGLSNKASDGGRSTSTLIPVLIIGGMLVAVVVVKLAGSRKRRHLAS